MSRVVGRGGRLQLARIDARVDARVIGRRILSVSMIGSVVGERVVRVGAATEARDFERCVPAGVDAEHGPERQYEPEHERDDTDGT